MGDNELMMGKVPKYSKVLKPRVVPTVVYHKKQRYDAARSSRADVRAKKKVMIFHVLYFYADMTYCCH